MKQENDNVKIEIVKDGPYLVYGKIPLYKELIEGHRYENHLFAKWGKLKMIDCEENYTLCRCGNSKNHPFCDSTHLSVKFNGKETAARKDFLKLADKVTGPNLILYDQYDLCFGAGFCHAKEGSTWELTKDSDNAKSRKVAIQQACDCPSGRLVAMDKKTGKMIEPKFEKSISVIEDNRKHVSGPLYVKGGIEIVSSDGFKYEVRNRVTLCRCGASDNKPFCDGSHSTVGFKDNDKDLE